MLTSSLGLERGTLVVPGCRGLRTSSVFAAGPSHPSCNGKGLAYFGVVGFSGHHPSVKHYNYRATALYPQTLNSKAAPKP